MSDRTWTLTTESVPTEAGYYQTRYYNSQQEEWLYKALYYNPELGKWIGPWGWSYDREDPVPLPATHPDAFMSDGQHRMCTKIVHKGITVEKYDPNSRTDFYTQQFSQT